jgi:hypothetical protein
MQLFSSPEILSDHRDRSTYKFILPPRAVPHGLPPIDEIDEVRIAVLWGIDRDQLIVAVLTALYLRNRDVLERVVAVRQERGKVDFWCRPSNDITVEGIRLALQDAVDAVMFTRWKVNTGAALPCTADGLLVDWEQLPESDPLRGVARSYGLGLHVKGGTRRDGAL